MTLSTRIASSAMIVTVVVVIVTTTVTATTTATFQVQAYATAGNPKTPEKEIMAAPGDPSPQVQQLAFGGICAFDDNVKALQEQLEVEFTDAMIQKLKIETVKALNDTVAFVNANDPVEPIILGNPEDCD